MTIHLEEERSHGKHAASDGARAHRRNLLAVALLAITLIGGVSARLAARGDGATPLPIPGATPELQFSAPGDGPVRFGGRLDRGSVLGGGDGLVNMELVIEGQPGEKSAVLRVPTDLVVVLDRSGSMRGHALEQALTAVLALLDGLSPEDRFAFVTYASGAELRIPLSSATDGAREQWRRIVLAVQATGGTNMAGGLDLALAEVEGKRASGRSPRVVLLSDGLANEGDHSRSGLLARAQRAVAGEYVVSAVGVGEGFDEALMTAIADAGTGNFYYVDDRTSAGGLREVFAGEFASARGSLAQGLEVTIEPRAGVEVLDAAGYPLERIGRTVRFRPGALFAGQLRRVWVKLRVPVDAPEAGADSLREIGDFALRYRSLAREGAAPSTRTLRFDRTPAVAWVKGEAEYLADIESDVWESGVIEDGFGTLKQKVAEALRAGNADAARDRIREFSAEQSRMNAFVQSARVDEVLDAVGEMEAKVEAARAPAAAPMRNLLSKKLLSEGYDERRQGAKY